MGQWFDRTAASQWATGPVTVYEEVQATSPGVAIADLRGGNLVVDFLNTSTLVIAHSTTVLIGPTLPFSPPTVSMDITGNSIVVGYIYSDSFFYFNTVNTNTYLLGTTAPGYQLANTAGATYISVTAGATSSQAIFTYEHTGLGYIVIIDVTTNTVIAGPTAFSIAPITYSNANTSVDKDGNPTYVIVYVDAATKFLNYVMYNSTLTATVYPIATLVQTENPTHL